MKISDYTYQEFNNLPFDEQWEFYDNTSYSPNHTNFHMLMCMREHQQNKISFDRLCELYPHPDNVAYFRNYFRKE